MSSEPQLNLDEALGFLRKWPAAYVHLVAIKVDPVTKEKVKQEDGGIVGQTFTRDDLDDDGPVAKWLMQHSGKANLYYTVNSVRTPMRDDTRSFVTEAVQCYESELYRAAVVMSWLAAVHVLKSEVLHKHLTAFNAEASRLDPKWKAAKTTDDLGTMKEAKFLDLLVAISVIGKNVKDELQECLRTRNGCGHPNSLKVSVNKVASHIEILLLNVLQPLAK